MVPCSLLQEHRHEGQDDGGEAGWQVHGGVSWRGRANLPLARSAAPTVLPAASRPSMIQMAKVEIRPPDRWPPQLPPEFTPA
jgi:hypothetical protein